jgi:hypothetical protein
MSDEQPPPAPRPRAAALLRDYVQADAERRAVGALPEYRRSPEAAHQASERAAEAHRAWQAELASGGVEAGQ